MRGPGVASAIYEQYGVAMRMRIATAVAALALAVSACGSQAASSGPSTGSSAAKASAASSTLTGPWVRVTDPSGVRFQFPSGKAPTLSTSGGSTTRTYIAKAGGNAVASIVIIPTPVTLNVKNFFIQYPITLNAQGNTNIKAEVVKTFVLQEFKGFQTAVRYTSPPSPGISGLSNIFEQREAIQLPKYFIVISAVAVNNQALTSADIAQAKAVNAQLLRTFSVGTK